MLPYSFAKSDKLQPKRKPVVVALMTSDRGGNSNHPYVFQTLTSLLLATLEHSSALTPEIHVFVGSQNSSYLNNLKHHLNLRVHPLPSGLVTSFHWKLAKTNWRAGKNYIRCLNLTSGKAGVLIVEDDVVFSVNFWPRLLDTINQIEQDYPEKDWALDLYVRNPYHTKLDSSKLYVKYVDKFCCTQAMYYTPGAAKIVIQTLTKLMTMNRNVHYDMAVSYAELSQMFPLFGANPPLVQHIGISSSIVQSTRFHVTSFGWEAAQNPYVEQTKTGKLHYTEAATVDLEKYKLHAHKRKQQ